MRGRRIALLFACMTAFSLHAESGSDAWLRYQGPPGAGWPTLMCKRWAIQSHCWVALKSCSPRAMNSREAFGECSAAFLGTIPLCRQQEVS